MKNLIMLKIVVGIMTLFLIVGAGFVFYGLVTGGNINNTTLHTSFSIPKNSTLISYHTHGEYITLIYSCRKDILFESLNLKRHKISTVIAKDIATPPYNKCEYDNYKSNNEN